MENELITKELTNEELIKKVNDLDLRVQMIENKLHRDKIFKRVTYAIYLALIIGIIIFIYFYYKNVYGNLIDML